MCMRVLRACVCGCSSNVCEGAFRACTRVPCAWVRCVVTTARPRVVTWASSSAAPCRSLLRTQRALHCTAAPLACPKPPHPHPHTHTPTRAGHALARAWSHCLPTHTHTIVMYPSLVSCARACPPPLRPVLRQVRAAGGRAERCRGHRLRHPHHSPHRVHACRGAVTFTHPSLHSHTCARPAPPPSPMPPVPPPRPTQCTKQVPFCSRRGRWPRRHEELRTQEWQQVAEV
jgi:hypothetical protein